MIPAQKSIADLECGQIAIIKALHGPEALTLALLKQGLTPGTPIEKKFKGCFGDPIAYQARGAMIALRKEEAQCLLI